MLPELEDELLELDDDEGFKAELLLEAEVPLRELDEDKLES
jgi:hypothetical protein